MRYVAPIVEGHGEVEALPALLHRIAILAGVEGTLRVNPPIRGKAGSFLHDHDYFRKQVALAAAKAAQGGGAVLILLDCEDEFDLEEALTNPSFNRFYQRIHQLLEGLDGTQERLTTPPS